jgi:hypothetical protein
MMHGGMSFVASNVTGQNIYNLGYFLPKLLTKEIVLEMLVVPKITKGMGMK